MKGIKMSDCKFYVDEEARIVVCVIPDTSRMIYEFVWDNFNWGDISISDAIETSLRRKLKMPHCFIGKARCSEEDNWDVELGKMIAFSRAKDKCYKSFFKRANMLVQALDGRLGDMIESFNNFGLKLEERRDSLQERINEGLGVEEEEE